MRRALVVTFNVLLAAAALFAAWTIYVPHASVATLTHILPADLWSLIQAGREYRIEAFGGLGVLLVGNLAVRIVKLPKRKRRERKANVHRSEVDLSGIAADAPDRVERVGERLAARAKNEKVEVMDLVDDMIVAAEFLYASDIHIEPKETDTRVSFRIDGVLRDMLSWPRSRDVRVMNRFRVIAKLDIMAVDTPQDGRIDEKIRGRAMNLRISVFPTLYGPKIVLRLLDAGAHALPPLAELGVHSTVLSGLRRLIHAPQGIVLFTGPTGSGKTTLMYCALREIIESEETRRNVVTLEDPIERVLPQINQTQVDDKRGISFASGLRTLLRQDPNVIMVGEIRDLETAEIALRAGQTGHLLLSTLHTNSAASAFGRLIDMGIEPFLLASSITGVVSMRLVRRLCPKCKFEKPPSEVFLNQLPSRPGSNAHFFERKGCEACRFTGFQGRMLVCELLEVTDVVAEAILQKQSTPEIQRAAESAGMVPIMADGLSKVENGLTSLVELLRVVK
jgi:type II secretory ATPase GspE/PulE/Tfp pilus assembly ATPase PilB-like protein